MSHAAVSSALVFNNISVELGGTVDMMMPGM